MLASELISKIAEKIEVLGDYEVCVGDYDWNNFGFAEGVDEDGTIYMHSEDNPVKYE